ncbi:MAG: hypothetical protein E7170_04470 [Firmicutes bacterium]|nr:hypothetical protein [Bacillota bacterium]
MSKQIFEDCNDLANNGLNNKGKGNLSKFLLGYLKLSQSMGKEDIAYEAIAELPPSAALVNPDPRVDIVVSMCEEELTKTQQQTVSMVR